MVRRYILCKRVLIIVYATEQLRRIAPEWGASARWPKKADSERGAVGGIVFCPAKHAAMEAACFAWSKPVIAQVVRKVNLETNDAAKLDWKQGTQPLGGCVRVIPCPGA